MFMTPEKVLVVRLVELAAAVVVTNVKASGGVDKRATNILSLRMLVLVIAGVIVSIFFSYSSSAAILPEDRSDIMYHGYEGGGLEVVGPSVLVRKGFKDKVSVWANYYVDMITSASIDVVATASQYTEERKEKSIGFDYLHGKTFMGMSYTNSEESDYSAQAARIAISQDFFGDLTTLGISYARGSDTVRRNGDDVFEAETERQIYRVDISQVITKNLIININYESVTDEGFLNNPYRQVRFVDPSVNRGFSYELEVYPRTRTSSAQAIRAMYFLPYRAALKLEYRNYSDTWGINAFNGEIAYTHPIDETGLTVELKYRYYEQTGADFYSDLFPRSNAQNFLARDKELAAFQTQTIGAGITYEFGLDWLPGFERGQASLFVDYIDFQYDDFRDVTQTGFALGTEPLYGFDATVLRLFFSFYY